MGKDSILTVDLHGCNQYQAKIRLDSAFRRVGREVYRIRVIHGYHGGTRIRSGIQEEFSYGREPKVKRIEMGNNPGITDLILREF